MECLLIFFALLAFATFSIRAAAGEGAGGKRRRSFQQVARQFSGRFTAGGWFSQPVVRFRYGDTFVTLTEATLRAPHPVRCTQLKIKWPDSRLAAEMFSDGAQTHPVAARTLNRITTVDAEFNARMTVYGTNQDEVTRLLSDGVRWQIIRLVQLVRDHDLYISVGGGQLTIHTPKLLRSFEALKIFVEQGVALYDQAMITRAVGIEFIENGQATTLEHVICKICGEEIAGHEMVYCQRCKTPHHADCWQYAGSCSVYGCLEKNFRRPQAATTGNHPHTSAVRDPNSTERNGGDRDEI